MENEAESIGPEVIRFREREKRASTPARSGKKQASAIRTGKRNPNR